MAAVPEHLLVGDVLSACSALLSGRWLHFQPGGDLDSGYVISRPESIPPAQRQLLLREAEAGWLLRRVEGLIAALAGLQSVVHEALVAAARREVSNYYRLVAILEAQAAAAAGGGGGAPPAEGALTLRRLQVWLSEPLARLRVLAGCLEAAKDVRGGQVRRRTASARWRAVGGRLGARCVDHPRALTASSNALAQQPGQLQPVPSSRPPTRPPRNPALLRWTGDQRAARAVQAW